MSVGVDVQTRCCETERAGDLGPDERRNFVLGVISGVAYNVNASLLSTQLVMTWFVSELTESNLLISLLVPIEIGTWYVLQPFLSCYVRRRSRALPLYRAMAVIRVGALASLTLAAACMGSRVILLPVFMVLFTVYRVAAGTAALPFLSVVAKTVPADRRGRYFGWRRFAGGLLAMAGAVLVKTVLSPGFALGFPANYAVLFAGGCLVTVVMVATFCLVDEPGGPAESDGTVPAEPFRRRLERALADRNYVRFLALRVALAVASWAVPFYVVYARRGLGVSGDAVGTYVMASTAAGVVSNLALGWIGDRHGNRLLVRLAALTAVFPPAAALVIAHLAGPALEHGALFTTIFVLQGLHMTAHSIGSSNYLLELGSAPQRVTYVSVAHGVIGLALLGSPLGGALVDWMSFETLFAVSLGSALLALVLSTGLGEPRERPEASGHRSAVSSQGAEVHQGMVEEIEGFDRHTMRRRIMDSTMRGTD